MEWWMWVIAYFVVGVILMFPYSYLYNKYRWGVNPCPWPWEPDYKEIGLSDLLLCFAGWAVLIFMLILYSIVRLLIVAVTSVCSLFPIDYFRKLGKGE